MAVARYETWVDTPQPLPIDDVATAAGIDTSTLLPYGRHVAKLPLDAGADNPRGAVVLITALTPTPLGEGKTTTAIGLAQGLARLGRRPVLTLRQPSLGPTFGIKGGAAGAGRSQVVPPDLLNMHLTGDFHAVTSAHNLLAAMVDNHLHHGNATGLDPRTITWPRVLDMNDRALRHIVIGLGARADGVTRESSFEITAASEVMAVLALAHDRADLRDRLGRIVVGYRVDGSPVTAEDLGAAGAMAAILRDALLPNLMQTTEGMPVLVHTGPFGNISIGNSSVVADQVGARLGDFLITEAGFGSDLGAERYVNIKSRVTGLVPHVAVVVVTVRALKTHSGNFRIVAGRALPAGLLEEDTAAVAAGLHNLAHHVRTVRHWGIAPVIAINVFPEDHPSEHAVIEQFAARLGVPAVRTTHVTDGGAGAVELARAVADAVDGRPAPALHRDYELDMPVAEKLLAVARGVHGAAGIDVSPEAARELGRLTALGFGGLPVVVAKTHLSLTHVPGLEPDGAWVLPVREVRLAAGAGYVYALCGTISTMPGLPAHPNAERVDVDAVGSITGLL